MKMNHVHIVNLGMNMINNMKNNETVHYHVLGGLHGCMPSFNEVYDHIETSKDRLSDIINDFEDSKNIVALDSDECYAEISKKTDSLCDYIEIVNCMDKDCLEEGYDE